MDEDLGIARTDRLSRGDALGRYVVLDRIGAGAMGLVYAAYDPKLDRRVAIKLLRASFGHDAASPRAQRLVREAQAMAKLAHPNVVTVHDVGTHGDRVFLAMEYVAGQTLGRWLQQRRPWSEVLEVFGAAGRGLAAAHAKGLVHRDFKPDNVMIGDDRRVQVMDFGLARIGEGTESESQSVPERGSSRQPAVLSSRITHTGAMLGTPAYMAPEQHLHRVFDARSDQFAFCVALFEGLYGQRPFLGDTPAAVGMAIIDGAIAEPPSGHGVPRWLHLAVTRGLAKDPDQRYADMQQLLAALQAAPRRRRAGGLAVAGLGLALAGGVWASAGDDAAGPCEGATEQFEGVWDASRRQRVAEAMRATGSPVATETLERVTERLDRYAHSWVDMRTQSCEATRVRGEQSEALLDLRSACLDQRLRAVGDLVDVFERADAEVVSNAVATAAGLAPLDDCADVVALRQGLPPPANPETANDVADLREQLGRLSVLTRAGRYDEGRRLASAARQHAETIGYAPVVAEALLVEGQLQSEEGAHDAAARSLSRAYFLAVQVRHDEVAARAAAQLTYEVGYRLARHELGFAWGEHALALGLRVGEAGPMEADAHHALGVLSDTTGDTDRAGRHYGRAYALRSESLPADHPDLARSLNALGNVHLDRGELAEALVDYRAALQLRERVFGPHHPEVAGSLNNVSIVLRRRGDHAGAIAALRRALAIYEAIHGQDHPDVAQSRNNLGLTLREAGQPAMALAEHERALAIRERILEPGHPDLGDSLLGLGRALVEQGRHTEALEPIGRALALYEQAFGPDHPLVAEALIGLGAARLAAGRATEAVDPLTRAVAILDARSPTVEGRAEADALLQRAKAGELPPVTGATEAPASPGPPPGSPSPPPARDRPPDPAE
ncbi:MAG: tetratricopeptide repeat protein [Nannocystaceae bacterium]